MPDGAEELLIPLARPVSPVDVLPELEAQKLAYDADTKSRQAAIVEANKEHYRIQSYRASVVRAIDEANAALAGRTSEQVALASHPVGEHVPTSCDA